jgi:hypothetical protein
VNAEHPFAGPDVRREWLIANLFAFAVGGALFGGVLRALEQPYYGMMTSAVEAGYIQARGAGVAGLIFGSLVGVAQWLVLRRTIRAGWWALGTGVGWGLSGVLSGFNAGGSVSTIGPDAGPLPPLLYLPVVLPLVVFLLGSAQWLVLRREFVGAEWWLLANVGGLIAGFIVGFVVSKALPWLTPTDYPSAQALGIVGAVAGPVYGLLTWAFLADLRRPEVPSQGARSTVP